MKWLWVLKTLVHPSLLPLALATFVSVAGPGGVAEIGYHSSLAVNPRMLVDAPLTLAPPSEPLVRFVPSSIAQPAADPEVNGPALPNEAPVAPQPGPFIEDPVEQTVFIESAPPASDEDSMPAPPSPTPAPSHAPNKDASAPVPTPAPTATPAPLPENDGGDDDSVEPTSTPNAPEPTSAPEPTPTPSPTPDDEGEPTPTPSPTPDDEGDPTPTPSPTPDGDDGDPSPTPTPAPDDDDDPVCDAPGTGPEPHDGVPPGHDKNGDGIDDRCQDEDNVAGSETRDHDQDRDRDDDE